jgi:hypothetical protein
MSASRYEGKPLLRLAEFYVLWSIGELEAADSTRLEAMAPKLAGLYGGDGSWHGAVAAALNFPPGLPEEIRTIWDNNRRSHRLLGRVLPPQAFAQAFIDNNSANPQG